jgi:hypothetical protein
MKSKNVKVRELVAWDIYADAGAAKALPEIYEHAEKTSQTARDWYWRSIKSKRITSLGVRFLSFLLVVFGAVLPIFAGLADEVMTRLYCTQIGVASLAVAGLLQAADKVFGWSSGWLRYMTTVTAMEAATRKFDLDWANYMISKAGVIGDDDKRPLFELAKGLEEEVTRLQVDETDKWFAEFNSGLALLNDLIKSQRESAEKTAAAARAAASAREAVNLEPKKA